MYESASPQAPLAHLSDICAMSSSETQSATVEIICEVCNSAVQTKNGEMSCKCGVRRNSYASFMDPRLGGNQILIQLMILPSVLIAFRDRKSFKSMMSVCRARS